jgi:hypothetical protein
MKCWINKLSLLLVLAGAVHAAGVPTLKRQVIEVPSTASDWIWTYWKDINKDGLTDLLALVESQGRVFIYNQNTSGLPSAPDQSLELPEGTAWCTLHDVNRHPGDEILISTAEALAYYRQDDGVFETQPQVLFEAQQVFVKGTTPRVFDIGHRKNLKNAIPVIFPDHTILYDSDANYAFQPGKRIELEFKATIEEYTFHSWSLGSRQSRQIRIRTIAQAESEGREEKEPTKENEYIRKMLSQTEDKELQACFVEQRDLNNDGNKDVILLHLQQGIGIRTNLMIFQRQKDGTLPGQPDQILRCRGMPIFGDYPRPSYCSPFFDVNNDGFLDIALMELKTVPTSASAFLEMAASKGMAWTLTVRLSNQARGFPDRADFRMDFMTMLPISESFGDAVNLEGDFNADGRKDLIVRRSPTQTDIYLSSLRTGFFEREHRLQLKVPSEHQISSIKDLNGDGVTDISLIDYERGQITVFLSETSKTQGALQ